MRCTAATIPPRRTSTWIGPATPGAYAGRQRPVAATVTKPQESLNRRERLHASRSVRVAHQLRDVSAGTFHVYTHCVWAAKAHFRDDVDRVEFLRGLARVTAKYDWRCMGFCLMRTHYHLLVEVADGVLPTAMQSLNHGYACHFNRR